MTTLRSHTIDLSSYSFRISPLSNFYAVSSVLAPISFKIFKEKSAYGFI